MKNVFCGFVVFCLIIFGAERSAVAENAGFVFLRHGYGARPAALGEAVTASGGDLSSAAYNPSLLMQSGDKAQFSFAYNRIYADVSQSNLGCGFKFGSYAVAGLLNVGKIAGIERRAETASPDPLGEFEENNIVMALQAAMRAGNIDGGLALKYAYEKIDYSSANALMLDFGVNLDAGHGMRVGAAVRNIGGKYRFELARYSLPLEYRFGAVFSPPKLDNYRFLADIVVSRNSGTKTDLGFEWLPDKGFALRAGYGFGYDSRGLAFGGGMSYRHFTFDYAFVINRNDLGSSHRLTITVAP